MNKNSVSYRRSYSFENIVRDRSESSSKKLKFMKKLRNSVGSTRNSKYHITELCEKEVPKKKKEVYYSKGVEDSDDTEFIKDEIFREYDPSVLTLSRNNKPIENDKKKIKCALKHVFSSISGWIPGKGLPKGARDAGLSRESILSKEMCQFRKDTMPKLMKRSRHNCISSPMIDRRSDYMKDFENAYMVISKTNQVYDRRNNLSYVSSVEKFPTLDDVYDRPHFKIVKVKKYFSHICIYHFSFYLQEFLFLLYYK